MLHIRCNVCCEPTLGPFTAEDASKTSYHCTSKAGNHFLDRQGRCPWFLRWFSLCNRVMQGVNEDFDAAEEALAAADAELKVYLTEIRGLLDAGKEVCYVPLHKESHVIEVPEVCHHNTPPSAGPRTTRE